MRFLHCLGVLLVLAVLAVPAALGDGSRRISQHAIGGVGLGLRSGDYERLLGEKGFRTRYANGATRLAFARAELDVFLGRSGRGIRITTAAKEYTLAGGVGPCGRLDALARGRQLTSYALRGAFGAAAVVYRTGRLWFTLNGDSRLGSVTLSAAKPSLQALLGGVQCGSGGEEGGE